MKKNNQEITQKLNKLRKAWLSFHDVNDALLVLEKYLGAKNSVIQTAATEIFTIAIQPPNNPKSVATLLIPLLVHSLTDDDYHIREAGANALGAIPKYGGDIQPVLPKLANCLSDSVESVVEATAHALFSCVYYKYNLQFARTQLEKVLDSSNEWIRHYASITLSYDLQRSGEESPLPAACSHRRQYALNDEQLPNIERHCSCGVCASQATVCIYHWGYGSAAGVHQIWEYHCLDCGKYTLQKHDTG